MAKKLLDENEGDLTQLRVVKIDIPAVEWQDAACALFEMVGKIEHGRLVAIPVAAVLEQRERAPPFAGSPATGGPYRSHVPGPQQPRFRRHTDSRQCRHAQRPAGFGHYWAGTFRARAA